MDIIKAAKRFAPGINETELNKIFVKLIRDKHYRMAIERMSALHIVKLVYMIWAIKNDKDPYQVLDNFNTSLFVFSIIHFDDDDSVVNCDNCSGDGSFDCEYCSNGMEDCGDCNGTGHNPDYDADDEDSSESCEICDGDGRVECSECKGESSFQCDDCDGRGELILDGYTNYRIRDYVSIDPEIKKKIEILNISVVPMEYELLVKIANSAINIDIHEFDAGDHPEVCSKIKLDLRDNMFVNKFKEIMDFDLKTYFSQSNPIYVDEIEGIDMDKFTEE